jgi:hypothetical protein
MLQNCMSYLYMENNIIINKLPASTEFQTISQTSQRYFYKYFSIVIIPFPSITGIIIQ